MRDASGGIVSQSASVTIEIEQVDLPSAAARLDLEGSQQQQKRMDEPRERGAPLAVANLSLVAVTDRRLFDPPARQISLSPSTSGWAANPHTGRNDS